MRRLLTLCLLLGALSARAQYQPYAVQWLQHASTAQAGRNYLGIPNYSAGSNVVFTPNGTLGITISATGGGGGGSTNFVLKSGDTMTGPLSVIDNPINPTALMTAHGVELIGQNDPAYIANDDNGGISIFTVGVGSYPGGTPAVTIDLNGTMGVAGGVHSPGIFSGNGSGLSNIVASSGWPTTWNYTSIISPGHLVTNKDTTSITLYGAFGVTNLAGTNQGLMLTMAGTNFAMRVDAGAANTLVITNGKVGILTSSPDATLKIGSGFSVNSTINLKVDGRGWFGDGVWYDASQTCFVGSRISGLGFYNGSWGIVTKAGDVTIGGNIADMNGGVLMVKSTGQVTTSGTLAATNGVASNSRRLLAPVAITVGASPYSFTNAPISGPGGTNNIFVFVDGAGVTGTVGVNGTTIFSTLVGADVTIPLQPQEYVTITWSLGTPVMKWKPF